MSVATVSSIRSNESRIVEKEFLQIGRFGRPTPMGRAFQEANLTPAVQGDAQGRDVMVRQALVARRRTEAAVRTVLSRQRRGRRADGTAFRVRTAVVIWAPRKQHCLATWSWTTSNSCGPRFQGLAE